MTHPNLEAATRAALKEIEALMNAEQDRQIAIGFDPNLQHNPYTVTCARWAAMFDATQVLEKYLDAVEKAPAALAMTGEGLPIDITTSDGYRIVQDGTRLGNITYFSKYRTSDAIQTCRESSVPDLPAQAVLSLARDLARARAPRASLADDAGAVERAAKVLAEAFSAFLDGPDEPAVVQAAEDALRAAEAKP